GLAHGGREAHPRAVRRPHRCGMGELGHRSSAPGRRGIVLAAPCLTKNYARETLEALPMDPDGTSKLLTPHLYEEDMPDSAPEPRPPDSEPSRDPEPEIMEPREHTDSPGDADIGGPGPHPDLPSQRDASSPGPQP